jgi:hypothetical protein
MTKKMDGWSFLLQKHARGGEIFHLLSGTDGLER